MKTIGLIGGMSWESTIVYYQHLNRLARARLGGLASAELVLWSFDFARIEELQARGDWAAATAAMINAARAVERAGAACLIICTNTMHRMAEEVQAAISIPLIHIADVTAAAIKASPCRRPLLLATRYTMEQDFYRGRLSRLGVDTVVPDAPGRTVIHDIIYRELCQGIMRADSKARYLDIIAGCEADGVIFGCTEIGLLIAQSDLDVPAFDTTELHAAAALDFALTADEDRAHG